MREKNRPTVNSKLRHHILEMPEEIRTASGIVINGRRIKSLVFTTDIAIIRNASIPVFCGVGGGTTNGVRSTLLATDAEAQGAMAVVVNAPMNNTDIERISHTIDIPVVVTVLNEHTDIDARLAAGASILNVSAAERTPQVVAAIREKYPDVPIIATGGPTPEGILKTVKAGANAISYTPPSTKQLFSTMMEDYRARES